MSLAAALTDGRSRERAKCCMADRPSVSPIKRSRRTPAASVEKLRTSPTLRFSIARCIMWDWPRALYANLVVALWRNALAVSNRVTRAALYPF